MGATFVRGILWVFLIVSLAMPATTLRAEPEAQAGPAVTVDMSAVDSDRGGAIFSIVVRNGTGPTLFSVNVVATLPAGATYEDSWTGDLPGSSPGQLAQNTVGWLVPKIEADTVAGPFRFRVAAPVGSTLTSRATIAWSLAEPTPGSPTTASSNEATVRVARAAAPVRVEVSVDRQSPPESVITLLVRNLTSEDLGLVSVYGSIPPGATVLASWTGDNPEHPGGVSGDQREVGWFNERLPKDGVQGPFRYRLQLPPGQSAKVQGRVVWLQPQRGEAASPETVVIEPPRPVETQPETAPPRAADPSPDIPLAAGRFFKQANGLGPLADAGFAVADGGTDIVGQEIKLWSAFRRLGGETALGYPISRRFKFNPGEPFVYQAFQKGLLQWNPAQNRAVLANLADLLSEAGLDPALESLGYAPTEKDSAGGDFARARQERLSWLETPGYQDLRDSYLSNPENEEILGLPAARPRTYGWIRVLRLQRGVLASYDDGPVVQASIGDDAKKLGYLAGEMVKPHPLAEAEQPDLVASARTGPAGIVPVAAAAPPAPAPPAVQPKFRELYTQTQADCSLTRLRGTVQDVRGDGINGLLVRSWNAEGNDFFSLVGYQQPVGHWERFLDYGVKPGVWNVQVVDANTKQPLSPVSVVRFNDQCGPGGVQEVWVHFRANY